MTLGEILEAREERWRKKCALSKETENGAVVSLTLRMPSDIRVTEKAKKLFLLSKAQLEDVLKKEFSCVRLEAEADSFDGPYAIWCVSGDAERIKKACMRFEEETAPGAFTDADVMIKGGSEISRLEAGGSDRKCLVCLKNARECILLKTHSREETLSAVSEKIDQLLLERV